jgi:tyrosyl-tRNA synthetase
MFGKLMSISDELMWRYFELLSFRSNGELAQLRQAVADGRNPRDVKFELGEELVSRFQGAGAGARARDAFIARFQKGAIPENLPEKRVTVDGGLVLLPQLLKQVGFAISASAAGRLIEQGAVRIDGEKITDVKRGLPAGFSGLLQVGKRDMARITLIAASENKA